MELQVLTAMNYRRRALGIISIRNFNSTNAGNVQFVRQNLRTPYSFFFLENFNLIKGRNTITFVIAVTFYHTSCLSVINNKHNKPTEKPKRFQKRKKIHTINTDTIRTTVLVNEGNTKIKYFARVFVFVCIYIYIYTK